MERTRNFVLLIFAVILVVSLIVFYAPSNTGIQDNLMRSDETVAKVGSEKITVGEMATIIQSRGGKIPAKMIINPLISQRLTRIEAERLGLVASDAEVASYIRQNFKEEGKPFDQNRYEQTAISQAGSISAFEQSIRDSLSGQKLEAYLTSGVSISEEEVLKDYQRRNTKFDVSYVPVSAADLAQTIKPTDDELKSYFEQNKKTYFINSPQKKIRYVFLNSTKVGEKLPVANAPEILAEVARVHLVAPVAGLRADLVVLAEQLQPIRRFPGKADRYRHLAAARHHRIVDLLERLELFGRHDVVGRQAQRVQARPATHVARPRRRRGTEE